MRCWGQRCDHSGEGLCHWFALGVKTSMKKEENNHLMMKQVQKLLQEK